MLLPMLLALAAQDTDKLPDPVPVESSTIVYAPSRSLIAATASGVADLPATPVSFRFTCLVDTARGEPLLCLPLAPGDKPITSRAEFTSRATAWAAGTDQPLARVAFARIRFTRVRNTPVPTGQAAAPLVPMIFTQSVSAADLVKLGEPVAILPSGDIEYDERPDGALLTSYYPAAGLSGNIEMRMQATCRILPSRQLLCRDAKPTEGAGSTPPALVRDFELATYQVLSSIRLMPLSKKGDPIVGREVVMRISFVVPE